MYTWRMRQKLIFFACVCVCYFPSKVTHLSFLQDWDSFTPLSFHELIDSWLRFWISFLIASGVSAVFSYLFIRRLSPIAFLGRCTTALHKLHQDNFILINADAFLLALRLYLQSIWYKLLKLFCCTKPALSNKVLAHVSTGAPKLPLCLQEPLKLLIAFCANGPYALDKVSTKSGAGYERCEAVHPQWVWLS